MLVLQYSNSIMYISHLLLCNMYIILISTSKETPAAPCCRQCSHDVGGCQCIGPPKRWRVCSQAIALSPVLYTGADGTSCAQSISTSDSGCRRIRDCLCLHRLRAVTFAFFCQYPCALRLNFEPAGAACADKTSPSAQCCTQRINSGESSSGPTWACSAARSRPAAKHWHAWAFT